MKEKIKKIFSKKITKAIIAALLILGISFGSFYFYKTQQQLEKNKEFVLDVVLTLKRIYDSRGLENDIGKEIKDEELKLLQQAYQMKEEIAEAKSIMEKWRNDSDGKRKKIDNSILEGIADLDTASDAFIRVAKDYKKEDVALFRVKLEKGLEKVFVGASGVVFYKIKLSSDSKKRIIEKIDSLFEKPIENYKENKSEKNFSQPQEIWAVILIRNKYANDLELPKI